MTDTTIKITTQYLEVDNVTDVVVTEAAQDTEVGDWVRDIRIFGQAAGESSLPIVLQVRIRSATKTDLDLMAPVQPW